MVRLNLEEAQVVARATKAPPGRAKANEVLKACREKLQNRCGDYIDLEAVPMFHWQAYVALHPNARAIFRSDVIGFLCEVFPEKEPNAPKLSGLTLRVDFVCLRADGSAVRLHPSKGAEAKISEGSLESWRSGATPIFALDSLAALARRSKTLVPDDPCGGDGVLVGKLPLGPPLLQVASAEVGLRAFQPSPPQGPPPQQMKVIMEEPATEQPPPPPGPPPGWPTPGKAPLDEHEGGGVVLAAATHPPTEILYTGITLAKFDCTLHGQEYLSFAKGVSITVMATPPEEPWAYGQLSQCKQSGWFPPAYVRRDLGGSQNLPSAFRVLDYSMVRKFGGAEQVGPTPRISPFPYTKSFILQSFCFEDSQRSWVDAGWIMDRCGVDLGLLLGLGRVLGGSYWRPRLIFD